MPNTSQHPAILSESWKFNLDAMPVFESIRRYFDETPSAFDLYIGRNKAGAVITGRYAVADRIFVDTRQARMNLVDFAQFAATGVTEFVELTDTRVFSLVATIARSSRIKEAESTYPKELALRDYFATLHIVVANDILGRLEDGKQAFSFEREAFPGFVVELSKYAPSFEESTDHLVALAEEHLPHVMNYGVLFQGLAQRAEGLLSQPKTVGRQQQLLDTLSEFYAIRADATATTYEVIINPFRHTMRAIKDSEVAKAMAPEKQELLELFTPYACIIDTDSPEEWYQAEVSELIAVASAWVEYAPFIRSILSAVKADAVKIGAIIDRKADETDSDYLYRIKELIEIEWTEIQRELLDFVESLDAFEAHEDVLRKMSELVGKSLSHADVTPNIYMVADVIHAITEQAESEGGGAQVLEARPVGDVVKTRILVQREGTRLLEEWNYVTGESKALEYPDNPNGCLIAYSPINILGDEQYEAFNKLMEAMRSRL